MNFPQGLGIMWNSHERLKKEQSEIITEDKLENYKKLKSKCSVKTNNTASVQWMNNNGGCASCKQLNNLHFNNFNKPYILINISQHIIDAN